MKKSKHENKQEDKLGDQQTRPGVMEGNSKERCELLAEPLENAARKFFASENGKQVLFFYARTAVLKYVVSISVVLTVAGLVGLWAGLNYMTKSAVATAVARKVDDLEEQFVGKVAQLDARIAASDRQLDAIDESVAIQSFLIDQVRRSLDGFRDTSDEMEAYAEQSKLLGIRMNKIQGSLDSNEQARIVEAIATLGDPKQARDILEKLRLLELAANRNEQSSQSRALHVDNIEKEVLDLSESLQAVLSMVDPVHQRITGGGGLVTIGASRNGNGGIWIKNHLGNEAIKITTNAGGDGRIEMANADGSSPIVYAPK